MCESSSQPLISVIMGVYNSNNKEELVKSLQSIKMQTFTFWECIICDDGSTDDTYDFLLKFTENDSRFRIIRNNDNHGLAYTLNKALREVRSQYVVRQDADDYSLENRFDKLYTYMCNHQDVDVLGTGMILYDENGIWGNYDIRTICAKKNDFLIGTVVAHPSVIMKTESLRSCGGYRVSPETRRCEDYDLFMRMYSQGYKICNIVDELYCYKLNRNGVKRKFKNVINESIVRVKGFKALGIGIQMVPYVLKPYIMYFVPTKIIRKLKRG